MASGQSAPSAGPAFENASVTAVNYQADEFRAVLGTAIKGDVRLTNATMIECLRFAFGVTNNFQIVGPDWMRSTDYRFNITGRAPADTPIEQLRAMLQNLLVERFQMAIHRETREVTVLILGVSEKGLKLQFAKPGADASSNAQVPGRIASNSMSMTQLTALLSHFLEEPVLDRTGMVGWYGVKLQWPVDASATNEASANAGIVGAIESQLGLVLERKKGPLEVLVVDRAEKKPLGH